MKSKRDTQTAYLRLRLAPTPLFPRRHLGPDATVQSRAGDDIELLHHAVRAFPAMMGYADPTIAAALIGEALNRFSNEQRRVMVNMLIQGSGLAINRERGEDEAGHPTTVYTPGLAHGRYEPLVSEGLRQASVAERAARAGLVLPE